MKRRNPSGMPITTIAAVRTAATSDRRRSPPGQFGEAVVSIASPFHPQAHNSMGQMNPAEERALRDSHGTTAPNTLTPDGRFFFDGRQWQVVPLEHEVTKRQRRMPSALVWLLITIAAIVGGGIIFEILLAIGMRTTR
jgi:hypothetical protein